MYIPPSYVQKCKIVAHVFQGLFIFIAGCITIAVLTKGGETGGPTRWYFALCFLTVPALIYLIMVPLWTRALRFANAYAYAALDILYTIFWFSAFIAVATWNAAGIRQGANDKKIDKNSGNCTTFAYGSESKCKLSRATVGFGVVVFILFLITSSISTYVLIQYRKTGILPTVAKSPSYDNPSSIEAQNKDAWSTDTRDIDDNPFGDHNDAESDDGTRTHQVVAQGGDEYALLHSTDTEEGRHPGRPLSWGLDERSGRQAYVQDEEAEYGRHTPSALSPGGYDEYRRGNYNFTGGQTSSYGS